MLIIQIKPFLAKCSEIYFCFCIYYLAEQELENQVHDILANTYETSSGDYNVPLQEILNEVKFELSTLGKQWKQNVQLIEDLLQKLFPTAKPKENEKEGNR